MKRKLPKYTIKKVVHYRIYRNDEFVTGTPITYADAQKVVVECKEADRLIIENRNKIEQLKTRLMQEKDLPESAAHVIATHRILNEAR